MQIMHLNLNRSLTNSHNSFYVYVDENNVPLLEAGFIGGIPSICMKIMRWLNGSWNDEGILYLLEAGMIKRTCLLRSWTDEKVLA